MMKPRNATKLSFEVLTFRLNSFNLFSFQIEFARKERVLVVKSLSSALESLFILLSDMHGMGDLTTLKSSFFPWGKFSIKT